MRILFVGDVFGAPGRRAVEARLPGLRDELAVDFCIVNGENAADGRGITAKLAERILAGRYGFGRALFERAMDLMRVDMCYLKLTPGPWR